MFHKSLAFLFRRSTPKPVVTGGTGYHYILTPPHNPDNLGRLALVRPYTLPRVDFNGRSHISVRGSIGGPHPVIPHMRSLSFSDPRGLAGNSPSPGVAHLAPLVKTQQFANPSPVGG